MSGMSELALAQRAKADIEALPATRQELQVSPLAPAMPSSDAASLMAVITRIAENPEIDLARIEKMLDMYERVAERQAKVAYTAALAEMQPQLPVIAERGGIKGQGGKVQSTYALWEDINDAIKPVLAEHGFALSFKTGREGDQIVVTGILSHRDGHSEQTTMHLPVDASGSKNAVQAVGSSTSYGKRYTAAALLNLTSRGEDDDGHAGGSGGVITEAQRDALILLADEGGADKRKFCEFFGIQSVADLPSRDYRRAEQMLREKIRAARRDEQK